MAQLIPMPQLGSTMEEGTILKWHKREGDTVQAGELLLEIETDKASMEVEAPASGVVRKLLAEENALIPIRQPIAIIAGADEPIEPLLAEAGGGAAPIHASTPALAVSPSAAPNGGVTPASPPLASLDGPLFISPRARRLADSNQVPLAALAGRGTGVEGRIVERDVLAYLASPPTMVAPALSETTAERPVVRTTPLAARIADDLGVNLNDLALGLPGSRVRSEDVRRYAEGSAAPATDQPAPPPAASAEYTTDPFTGMRKRIADNIVKSAFTIPHVTLTLEVDMTAAAAFRAQLMGEIEKAYGVRLTYNDILVKAVARALQEFPRLNASLVGDEIRLHKAKNIGVAVALEEGLVVPVVRNVESKSLGAISAELKPLIERARTSKFTPDDLLGGTFTLTNLGVFGIDVFDPVIVSGQAGILGVGRIAEKPVVRDGQIVARSMMNLCLSFDHRIIDGAPAARFLQRLKELLENPMLILI